jgi:hypothetical protein
VKGRLLGITIAGTVAFGLALGLNRHERALATAAYLDFVCAVLLISCAAAIGSAALPFASHLGRKRGTSPALEPRPDQLEWIERQLASAQTLRPLVVQIVSVALERNHGIVSEREPTRARALVGDRIWALIDPDIAVPASFTSRGHRDELGRLIDDLEAIT